MQSHLVHLQSHLVHFRPLAVTPSQLSVAPGPLSLSSIPGSLERLLSSPNWTRCENTSGTWTGFSSGGQNSGPGTTQIIAPGPLLVTPGPLTVAPGPLTVAPSPLTVAPGPLAVTPGPLTVAPGPLLGIESNEAAGIGESIGESILPRTRTGEGPARCKFCEAGRSRLWEGPE